MSDARARIEQTPESAAESARAETELDRAEGDADRDAHGHPSTQPTEQQRLEAAATGSVSVIASDTFGWIHPEVAHQPLTRRDLREHRTHLGAVALTLSVVGLAVSWFGPWGAVPALVGVVIALIALVRPTERRSWGWWALGIGLAALAASAYWLTWIVPRLELIAPA